MPRQSSHSVNAVRLDLPIYHEPTMEPYLDRRCASIVYAVDQSFCDDDELQNKKIEDLNNKVMELSKEICIEGYSPKRRVYCLVDSGSGFSLCSHGFVEKLLQDKVPVSIVDVDLKLSAPNATELIVDGQIIFHLTFDNVKLPVHCLIVRDLNRDLLLGRNFLVYHKCKVHFGQGVIQLHACLTPPEFYWEPDRAEPCEAIKRLEAKGYKPTTEYKQPLLDVEMSKEKQD